MKAMTDIVNFKADKLPTVLMASYFGVAAFEIVAEFFKEHCLIMYSKPLLMPILILLYLFTSKNRSYIFMAALVFAWIANMLFISKSFQLIITGTIFFTIYRILIICMVIKCIKLPDVFPLVIACLPFLFIYMFVTNLTYEELGDGFWLFVAQGFFTIIFGALSLGGYIFNSNKSNTYLLVSTMFFTFTQFIFVIRLYYISLNIFQPLAMLLYVMGQFMIYKFVLIEEQEVSRFEIISAEPKTS